MPQRHIPQRTCVACRSERPKRDMVRIVRAPEPLDAVEGHARFFHALAGRTEAAKGPDVGEAQA